MIRNDLHVHSIHSMCGMHTLLEIVEIAARKGVRMVNICDHGEAAGKKMNFGVIANKKRCPMEIPSENGTNVIVLAGIEANILDIQGNTDLPAKVEGRFDLISAGFHSAAKKLKQNGNPQDNTKAVENFLKSNPLDLFTHPCISRFPLDLEKMIKLSLEYGFALEVNNTNLRVGKTDVKQLRRLVRIAKDQGATLVENSDGHTYTEIGENEKIDELLTDMNVDGDALFINRNDEALDDFLERRLALRGETR